METNCSPDGVFGGSGYDPVLTGRLPLRTVVESDSFGMSRPAPGQVVAEAMRQRATATRAHHQAFQDVRGGVGLEMPDFTSYGMFLGGLAIIFVVVMYMRSS